MQPNQSLMAAGPVACVQVTLLRVVTGRTRLNLGFRGAADLDLEPVENRTLDGHT